MLELFTEFDLSESLKATTVLFAVITGNAGGVFLLIVTGVLLLLVPQMFVHVTV